MLPCPTHVFIIRHKLSSFDYVITYTSRQCREVINYFLHNRIFVNISFFGYTLSIL